MAVYIGDKYASLLKEQFVTIGIICLFLNVQSRYEFERFKDGNNNAIFPPDMMFWRTRKGLEIDVIEKTGIDIAAYECKWSLGDSPSFSVFLKAYPAAKAKVVHPLDLL